MIAKTFKGLEPVLAQELIALGANDVQIGRRAVTFSGDKALLYKANLWLRTASRIIVPIATFQAKNTDDVYKHIHAIPWEQYMTERNTFAIGGGVNSECVSFGHILLPRYGMYMLVNIIGVFGLKGSDGYDDT